ncbi:glycosyltransferase family 1 protein [Flammeovirga sp. SubArs3]|uniref:glycosyltransferase family 4 protein n=1 Tax=Flammeovirga sp. SubArs3 TaxID=2995316 RepID=UPI00248B7AC5|nr:glycosyltransferase family 1 protein [Flammeovirga sp. SubArs3]
MIQVNTRNLLSHKTGVQRYTEEIIKNFPKDQYDIIFPSRNNAHGIRGHIWEQLYLPFLLKNDILWSPSNSGPIQTKGPHIVTIHDVVPMDHPEWLNYKFARWYQFMLPKLAKSVDHIITISNFSKERIIQTLKVPDKKISVIPNGVDHSLFNTNSIHQENVIPFKRYIITLGSLEPRKNLLRLFKAWKDIKNSIDDDIHLVVVGKKGLSRVFSSENYDFENLQQERIYFTGHLTDSDLVSALRNAIAFTYLSEYEGFGLPPLEAMACGVPVITSNTTAFPEVVKDSAITISPYDINDISKSIKTIIENDKLRKKLSIKGISQAGHFNWKKTSAETIKILKSYL